MKFVFVDLGCFDGDTVLQFRNWRQLKYSPDIEWEVHAFDPTSYKDWQRHADKHTHFYKQAAWIRNGDIEYSEYGIGSTVMKEKRDWDKGTVRNVQCFDFSEWLKQFRGDHVILKMDIEGSELPILTKMIADGTDDIADITFVEWHDGKMPQYKSNKHEILEQYRGKLRNWR